MSEVERLQALGEPFLAAARNSPDAVHIIVVGSDGSRVEHRYGATAGRARGLAERLVAAGLRPGESVAVIGDPSPAQIEATLAVWLAGGVLVPLDPEWEPAAHERALAKAAVRVGIALSERAEQLAAAAQKIARFELLVHDLDAPVVDDGPLPVVDPEARALILFTSGTTGEPKAAVLRHRALAWNAAAMRDAIGVSASDNLLNVLPLHHSFGLLASVIFPPLVGARVTFPASLKGPDVVAAIRSSGVTLIAAVPQLMAGFDRALRARVAELGVFGRTVFHLLAALVRTARSVGLNPGKVLFHRLHAALGPELRFLGSAGAALDPAVARRLWSVGLNVVQGYGLTETGPTVSFDDVQRPCFRSVGRPLPGVDVRIVDPDEAGDGEIVVRSPSLFDGYLDDEAATAETLRDGWLYTGDLGRLDRAGRLFVTGRRKEVIVLGSGKNVYPYEVEARLEESEFIAEACVLGLAQDGRPGSDKLHAVVVPDFAALRRAGTGRIDVTMTEEIVRLGDGLPSHHRVVGGVTIRREPLPRTPLGKLKRHVVRADLTRDPAEAVARRAPERPDSVHWDAVAGALRDVAGDSGPIGVDTGLELDLGLDSLGRVEALAALERRLGRRLPEAFAADAITAGDVLAAVERHQAGETTDEGFAAEIAANDAALRSPSRRLLRACGVVLLVLFYVPIHVLAKLFWRFEVIGGDNLPDGAYLLCPNHGSYMDAIVMLAALPFRVILRTWAFGDYEIFGNPVMKVVGLLGNVIRLDAGAGLRSTLELGGAILKSGGVLILFPEGARASAGERLPFRRGAAILARASGRPLVPTWIEGSDRLLPRGSARIRFGHRVAVRYGRPIPAGAAADATDPAQSLTDRLRDEVESLGREASAEPVSRI